MAKKKEEKPLTLSQLIEFYGKTIEPRFQKIENKLEEHDEKFRHIDRNFDFLFKRFEDLHQEYVIASAQMKRFDAWGDRTEILEKEVQKLKNLKKVSH